MTALLDCGFLAGALMLGTLIGAALADDADRRVRRQLAADHRRPHVEIVSVHSCRPRSRL
jgi:hypothetical protein